MRSLVLSEALLASVTVAVVSVSAQIGLEQLKSHTQPAPAPGKAGAPKGATPAAPGNGAASGFPDIAGLRIGMPLREAFTILQAAHATTKLGMYPINVPGIDKPVLEGFSFGWETLAVHPERMIVDVTPPPNQKVVWKVRRYLAQQKIYRANVLSSLREKYGKETATTPAVSDDQHLTDTSWVLDEQGHPPKLPPPGIHWRAGIRGWPMRKTIYGNDPGSSWLRP